MAVDSTDPKSLKCIGEVVSEYKYVIMAILAVYIVYFLASNLMFIYALWKTKTGPISNTSLIFIFCSLSDIVMGVVLCPHVIYRYERNITLRPECNTGSSTWLVPQWLFSALSAYSAVLVGVHRYIKVRFNGFYKRYLTKRPYVIISFVVLTLLAVLPAVLSIFKPPIGSMLFGVIGVIGYIVSLLTCFLLAREWRRDSIRTSSQTKETKVSEKAADDMAKTKTITILAIILCLTWTPVITTAILTFAISQGANVSDYARRVIDACYEWTRLLLILNGGLNATIYMIRTFKLSKLFGRRRDVREGLRKSHADFLDDATETALKQVMRVAMQAVYDADKFDEVRRSIDGEELVTTNAGIDNPVITPDDNPEPAIVITMDNDAATTDDDKLSDNN